MPSLRGTLSSFTLVLALAPALLASGPGIPTDWIASGAFGDVAARAGWRPVGDWVFDEADPQGRVVPGEGVLLDPSGEARDLISLESLGDLELAAEVCLAPGSSATALLMGRYAVRLTPGGSGVLAGSVAVWVVVQGNRI